MAAELVMNGTNFFVSRIVRDKEKVGDLVRAKSGYRRWVHRAHKHDWQIEWIGVTNAVRIQVLTIFDLTTTFTLVDVDGSSFTAQCESDGYSQSTDADHFNPFDDSLRWDITLKVFEQ